MNIPIHFFLIVYDLRSGAMAQLEQATLEEWWRAFPARLRTSPEALDAALLSFFRIHPLKCVDDSPRSPGVHHWHFLLGPVLTASLQAFQDQLIHDEFVEFFFDTKDHDLMKMGAWLRLRQYYVRSSSTLLTPEDRRGLWSLKRTVSGPEEQFHEVQYKESHNVGKICQHLAEWLNVPLKSETNPLTYCNVSLCGFTTHRYRVNSESSWWVDCALIPLRTGMPEDPTVPVPDTCFACLTQESRENVTDGPDLNLIEHYTNDVISPSKAIIALAIRNEIDVPVTRDQALALCQNKNPFGHTYSADDDE